jgi:tRNA threonylcarbamoyl adenosine modification protein YjeE
VQIGNIFNKNDANRYLKYINALQCRIFLLIGEIGIGKTTFVRNVLGDQYEVTSPTFSICHQYSENIFHYDLYRIEPTLEKLEQIGLLYALESKQVFIEWPDRIDQNLLKPYLNQIYYIYFDNEKIKISNTQ